LIVTAPECITAERDGYYGIAEVIFESSLKVTKIGKMGGCRMPGSKRRREHPDQHFPAWCSWCARTQRDSSADRMPWPVFRWQ